MFLKFLTFIAIVSITLALSDEQKTGADVILVDDINQFRASNPDVNLVELQRAPNQPKVGIRYTLGARQAGDRLASSLSDFVSYGTPQNVALTLTYPTSGVGVVVTYVVVDVQQSSNLGRGYLVSGGIGQRHLQLVIEAYSTTYFGYTSYIYGK